MRSKVLLILIGLGVVGCGGGADRKLLSDLHRRSGRRLRDRGRPRHLQRHARRGVRRVRGLPYAARVGAIASGRSAGSSARRFHSAARSRSVRRPTTDQEQPQARYRRAGLRTGATIRQSRTLAF